MGGKVALELLHGRRSLFDRLDDWGVQGPVFLVDYVQLTYMGDLRLGLPCPLDACELRVVDNLVYYNGLYFGDWSVVSPDMLDNDQLRRVTSFDVPSAKLPMLGPCACCTHYRGVFECRGLDCQRCEACDPN